MKSLKMIVALLSLQLSCICAPISAAEPLRFAYQNRIGDAVSIIALAEGFFAAERVQVKGMLFNNGPACAEALYTGAVDIATMGDTTALSVVSRDPAMRILASHGAGEHRHRIIVAKNSPLRTLADLKGKLVGIKKGTSTHGGFLALLAANGLQTADIQLVDLSPDILPEALSAGSLDAFVASEPTPSMAETMGGRELGTLGGLGNDYPLLIVAKSIVLQMRETELVAFFRALRRAERFICENPAETAAILGKEDRLSAELARKAMTRHSYSLRLDDTVLKSLAQTARFLHGQHKISQMPDLKAVVSTRLLEISALPKK
jgi:ABC-type nitrate/sulfonate/bicarbonate transport system substrate-binding protein